MRRRLILGAAYLLLVVVAGLAVPFGLTLSRRLTSDLGGRVERQAFAVAAAVEDRLEHGDAASLQSLVALFARRIGGRVLLTDRSGVLLADSLQAPGQDAPSYRSRPEIARALAGAPNWEVRTSRSLGYDLLVSAVPVGPAGRILGVVRISFPMTELRAAVRRTWWFLGAVGAVALAAGLALAAWLAGWATGALATAATVARRIAGGDLGARVPEAGPPEVRGLATDMNAMADRVGDMVPCSSWEGRGSEGPRLSTWPRWRRIWWPAFPRTGFGSRSVEPGWCWPTPTGSGRSWGTCWRTPAGSPGRAS